MRHKLRSLIRKVLIISFISVMFSPVQVNADEDYGYQERVFTADDGLPTTATLSIAQTKDGFLWMGGYGGLSRYDGNEFVSVGDTRVSNVSALSSTEDNKLWVVSLDYGIMRYEDHSFKYFDETVCEKPPVSVRAIAAAEDGTLYFASAEGLGMIDTDDQVRWVNDVNLTDVPVAALACGKEKMLWCVTDEGKVYSYHDEEVVELDISVGGEKLCSIDYDSLNDQFWLGTEKNTVVRCSTDLSEKSEIKLEGASNINAFGFVSKDEVYVCSDTGVASVNRDEVSAVSQKVDNSVEDMLIDMDGNFWFASSRQGVLLVSKGRFKDISARAGINDCIVNTIAYENGRLYVGHDTGYYILDEKTYEVIEDPAYSFLDGKRIREIYIDSQSRMWICTTGEGLYVRNLNGTWKNYSTSEYPVLHSDKFRAVIESSSGIVAATDAGAYLINDDGVELLAEGLDMRILSLTEANDTIYCGTDGQGIYAIKDRKVIKQITIKDGLSSMRIMKMVECSGHRGLWMATGNNLDYLLFETEQVYHAETFPSANVLDCLLTQGETLWIIAGNGIYQTTETAVLRDNNIRDYHHYSKRNGIPYDLTANSYSVVIDDHAYLCGSEGVAWMNIEPEYSIPDQYSIIIDQIRMDDETFYVQNNESIEIGSDVRRIEISAHMATYTQENPTMFYYLEGFDDTYHYVSFEKLAPIIYTNIPGGDYVFHFGVYDPATALPRQEKTKEIHVGYEWRERPSFRIYITAGVLACLAAITYLIYRMKSKKEKQQLEQAFIEREKSILKKQAYTDYLTELYNRNYLSRFDGSYIDEIKFPVNFVAIDCNNLKTVNDNYGHDQGDALLKTLADLLRKHFFEEKDFILRLGGDEFLVISEGKSEDEVEEKVNRIAQEAADIMIGDFPISFCYGMSSCEERDRYDLKKLTQEADELMITNKQLFHSRVYDDEKTVDIYDTNTGKRIERHIKHDILSNILYEAFAESSDNVYIYAHDMNTNVTRWSKNCVDFFDLPAEYMKDGQNAWIALVHPDDVEAYVDDLDAVFTGRKMRHACQYRIRNRFNQYVWVECKGSVIRSANGATLFAGMITRLDNQSIYDPLTGLRTKNQFYDFMEKYDQGIVLNMSIDEFKEIIKTYGYENGDKLLIQVGKIFMKHSSENQEVFRFGGPEFVYIIPNGTEDDVERIFTTVCAEASEILLETGVKLKLRYTGAAAYFTRKTETTDDVVNNMELALEHAKEKHSGQFVMYSEEIQDEFRRRTLIRKELKESIQNGFSGFELYYQPLVEKESRKIMGCEALLRWKSEAVKDSYPAEFIPILEESGDIIEVGRFVMREAMRQQKIWSEKYGSFVVSFNVSYYQFLTEGYVNEIIETAKEIGVDPSCMIIELTESRSVQSPQVLANIFEELRAYGFRIMLDDFGTGYASLEMLKTLPSDGIKIEHNFVRDINKEGHEIDLSIIRSIVNLCDELGQKVIVEGVENEEVDQIISNMQVGYLQGYYYSRPIETKSFEKLVNENRNHES